MKIAVSIGHTLSGSDTGASGYLNESRCTREIGELVKSKLEAQGHTVVYCRIDSAASKNDSMMYRVNKANAANVDLFIEIHLNSGGGYGTETFIHARGGKAEVYAKTICDAICELKFKNRGVRVAKEYLKYNLCVLANTNAPAVLIECCFVDSKSDSEKYNADKIANKIVKGITGIEKEEKKVELKPTHYINTDHNIPVYKEMELRTKFGELVPGEGIEYIYSDGTASYIMFGTGCLDGCIESKYITKIGEEPPIEETPGEPEGTKKNYKVTITCKDQAEANFIKGFMNNAKVEEY